jgi:predicted  nucleic acid-binding Zn-ribbon protein
VHPHLTTLLEIQDLRGQLRELTTDPAAAQVQAEHFNVDLAEAAHALEVKITELVGTLEPPIRRRYERTLASLGRVVVPVIEGVCYGCFVSIATMTAGEAGPNEALRTCESCGRFIYVLP